MGQISPDGVGHISSVANTLDGRSLKRTASELGISITTAFAWRHKLLAAHRDDQNPKLTGIVEADDTVFRESQKGSRNLDRRPRRRGGGLGSLHWVGETDSVCVLVAQDRKGHAAAQNLGISGPRRTPIRKLLGEVVDRSATLCSDGAQVYRKSCKGAGIATGSPFVKRLRGITKITRPRASFWRLARRERCAT